MGLISRFGNFLDRLFDQKATLADLSRLETKLTEETNLIHKRFEMHETGIQNLSDIASKVMADNLKLRDEMNALKAIMKISTGKTIETRPGSNPFDGSKPWKR